ncbi:hypothetical protein GGF40_004214 [Coemansia sp. RSA 1286]|nr:hypothetical protein GGF40_004214 [Coemansia sp. RSA 1286]
MNVIEKQRFYQVRSSHTGHGPIYARTAMSRTVVKGLFGLIIGGSLFATFNLGRLIAGKKP